MEAEEFKAKKQELFDKAYLGVLGQGKLASNSDRECYYTLGGLHCAAGWLLTEEQLQRVNELDLNEKPFDMVNRELNVVPWDLVEFVMEMQRAHDRSMVIDSFPLKMREVASHHGLTVPEFVA